MPLTNHFAALVTLEPDLPSQKRYALYPVQPHHGETAADVVAHFSAQAHLGFVFEAAGEVDAEIITTTILPHPTRVGDFTHVPNNELNAGLARYERT